MRLAVDRVIKGWRSTDQFVLGERRFKENGTGLGRRYSSHNTTDLAESAFNSFGLRIDAPEPHFGHMITNNYADGAFVHEHMDTAPQGFAQVRCNWMVKKPAVGGDPILDGEVVVVSEGDLWLCISSQEKHSSTPISGGQRLVYSFGALINLEQIHPLVLNDAC